MRKDYVTLKIPTELMDEVDTKLVGKFGFKSRAAVVKEGIRRMLHIYSEIQTYREP